MFETRYWKLHKILYLRVKFSAGIEEPCKRGKDGKKGENWKFERWFAEYILELSDFVINDFGNVGGAATCSYGAVGASRGTSTTWQYHCGQKKCAVKKSDDSKCPVLAVRWSRLLILTVDDFRWPNLTVGQHRQINNPDRLWRGCRPDTVRGDSSTEATRWIIVRGSDSNLNNESKRPGIFRSHRPLFSLPKFDYNLGLVLGCFSNNVHCG